MLAEQFTTLCVLASEVVVGLWVRQITLENQGSREVARAPGASENLAGRFKNA